MKTMAALAAPPSRAVAPPSDAGGAASGSDSSFAAVLGQARDPIKAAVDRPAKSQARAAPSAEPKTSAKPTADVARESVRDADVAPGEASTAQATDTPETVLPIPGWPAVPAVPEATSTSLLPAVAATLADDTATLEVDTTLSLDEGAPLANASTQGKLRAANATLQALVPADLAPGNPVATAAAAASAVTSTAAAAIALPLSAAKPATDAVAMTAPAWSALPSPVGIATPAAPAAAGKLHEAKATLPAQVPGLLPADLAPGKPDATAAAAASAATSTAAAAIALPLSVANPATDAVTMSAPMLSALPATVANATTAAPAAVGHAAALPFAAHLAATVDSPAFAPAFATQVSWLAKEGLQHARLTLNPAELGPVAVKIMLDGTQARIDFHVAIASTRAAIEASLPTLAAALHDSGMTLAGGGVSDGQARPGAQGNRAPAGQDPAHRSANGEHHDLHATAPPLRPARGLVDLVA